MSEVNKPYSLVGGYEAYWERWETWQAQSHYNCYQHAHDLDIAKMNGRTIIESYADKGEPHIWTNEEYQEMLAQIHDKGRKVGLTDETIDEEFSHAHADAASGKAS